MVHLEALPEPRYPANAATLSRMVAAAFNQRRKMLRAALKGTAPNIEDRLIAAGIKPTDRAEQISLEAFCASPEKSTSHNKSPITDRAFIYAMLHSVTRPLWDDRQPLPRQSSPCANYCAAFSLASAYLRPSLLVFRPVRLRWTRR